MATEGPYVVSDQRSFHVAVDRHLHIVAQRRGGCYRFHDKSARRSMLYQVTREEKEEQRQDRQCCHDSITPKEHAGITAR